MENNRTAMSSLVISGGIVITLGEKPRVIPNGAVRIRDGVIEEVGLATEVGTAGAELIEGSGQVILPGLINAHTHLYGALVRGLPWSGPPPTSFRDILERLWWRWDKLLDADAIRLSAQVGMLEALRSGVTTLIDHHASPNEIDGSLDLIAGAATKVGMRIATAYEVSDRDGSEVRDRGVQENIRFARRVSKEKPGLLGAAIGAHASFTLSDESLSLLAAAREETGAPIHIHMDEGTEDGEASRAASHKSTARRLADRGILREETILAHAVNIDSSDIPLLAERRAFVSHQPLSNGNNAVGRAPIPAMLSAGVRLCLGSDGMSGSLGVEALAAGAIHRMAEKDVTIPFDLPCRLAWEGNAQLAATLFDPPPGVLRPGAAGDIVLIDYDPPTEINESNLAGHWLLGILHAPVNRVIVAGQVVLDGGRLTRMDTARILADSRKCAESLWRRF